MTSTGVGIIVPSSNTVMEPLLASLLADPGIRLHHTRLRVTRIGLDETALGQFDRRAMLEAARLLADAGVKLICWGGTSGSWLGIDGDLALCAEIADTTGVVATTSTLALIDALIAVNAGRIGLAVPYTNDVTAAIIECYANVGISCAGAVNLGLEDNAAFADVPAHQVDEMVRTAAVPAAQAIALVCTNMTIAPRSSALEATLGVPVVDSIAATAWQIRTLLGLSSRRIA